eukprot:g2887.t1
MPKDSAAGSEITLLLLNMEEFIRLLLWNGKLGKLLVMSLGRMKLMEAVSLRCSRGPTGTMLNEITEASEDHNNCSVIFVSFSLDTGSVNVVLGSPCLSIKVPSREMEKCALQVLEFILKRGSERHVEAAKFEFMDLLDGLKDFNFIGDDGRDYGINVRVRSEAVKNLLEDETLLKTERAKLQKIHNKFRGYSRDEMEGNTSIDEVTRSNSWAGTAPVRSDGSGHEESASSVSSALRKSAGEMKGVSLEDNKKHIQALKKILSRPENRNCADCGEQMPTWASINCGVFVCLRCSGIHRSLGVHISKVRSCTLDTWLPKQVEFMDQTGNKVANAYWEAKLEPHLKPAGTNPMFSNFVQQKYSEKQFASGVWPPEEPVSTPVSSSTNGVAPAPIIEPVRVQPKLEFSAAKGDLLAFEDEAFGASTTAPVSSNIQPAPQNPPQFDNNALFEQRSSLVRMKSQISRDSNDSPKFASTSRSSHEVIHTTLLDFDDLESISETMSLASSINLHSINSSNNQQVSKTVNPVNHPVAVAPVPLRPPQPPKIPPSIEAKKQVKAEPVQDLLDAPLTVSPMTGNHGLDALEDPFSFMSTVEPVAIVQSTDSLEVRKKTTEQLTPQTPAFIQGPQLQSSVTTTQAGNEMNRNSSLNIQELSRLDELFVQQVDDFLQFGYLSSVKRHNYN